jgi:hypothetical protein
MAILIHRKEVLQSKPRRIKANQCFGFIRWCESIMNHIASGYGFLRSIDPTARIDMFITFFAGCP